MYGDSLDKHTVVRKTHKRIINCSNMEQQPFLLSICTQKSEQSHAHRHQWPNARQTTKTKNVVSRTDNTDNDDGLVEALHPSLSSQ